MGGDENVSGERIQQHIAAPDCTGERYQRELVIYHYGTKQAIAEEYMNGKMRELRHALMQKVDIRSEPELFCCTFVRLYQSVMASPNFCRFYHDIIEEGVFRSFFFEDDVYGINVSDLILAKRQVQLSSNMYSFYSHYIIPGIELASWISEGEKAPEGDKLDVPFRALMASSTCRRMRWTLTAHRRRIW